MSRRGRWLIGGAAAVVAVAAGVWIWQSTSRTPTPEESALSYLRALESGDPDAVEGAGVDVSAEALGAFAAATDFIEDAAVRTVSGGDGRPPGDEKATAEVSFLLDGEEHTAELSLTAVEGRWTVDASGFGTMTATTTTGSFVAIGAQTFPISKKTALLPAVYTIAAAPTTLLEGQSSMLVLPGEDSEIALDATVRPEATAAAQEQLDEHLTACTAPAGAAPEGCGIRIPWGTDFRAVSEFRYRVEELPVVTIEGTEFRADGGSLVSTVTGTGQDGTERTTTYRTDSWSVRGGVAFTADDLVLSVW
ncbi:hypothetical protein ACI2IP_00270 [Microbacterium sp. NPDC090218]